MLGSTFLLLAGVLMAISVTLDVLRAEQRFEDRANFIQSRFEALAGRNLIALQGFSALLKVTDPDNRDALFVYAQEVLQTQPPVYMLEVAHKVTREQLPALSASMAQQGIESFEPKRGEQGRLLPVPDKPVYYLLSFMAPPLPEARQVLGLDLESTTYLRSVLHEVVNTNRAVASPPFRLIEGDIAYLLIRSVERDDQQVFAMVVCKAKDLLPPELLGSERLSVRVDFEGVGKDDVEDRRLISLPARIQPGELARRLFPLLSAAHPIDGIEQPFRLTVEQQLDWDVIQFPMLGLIAVGGLSALLVLLSYAGAHHRHEMKSLEESEKLFTLANFDHLTGLPNRQLFKNRLEQALAVAHREGSMLAVLFLDLDGFKGINDFYGHQTGDRVLQRAAGIFQRCVREIDTVARLGGDEFVILLQNIDGLAKAQQVAHKIKKAFDKYAGEPNRTVPIIGVSIGISAYPADGSSAADLLNQADQAMYRDKSDRKSALLVADIPQEAIQP